MSDAPQIRSRVSDDGMTVSVTIRDRVGKSVDLDLGIEHVDDVLVYLAKVSAEAHRRIRENVHHAARQSGAKSTLS